MVAYQQNLEIPEDPFRYDFENPDRAKTTYTSIEETLHAPGVGLDLAKDKQLRLLADSAKANVRRRTEELKSKLLASGDEDQYDEFLRIADQRIDELVSLIWQEISTNTDRDVNYNGVYGSAKAGLFCLATIRDLDDILDANNDLSFAGMMEGGDFNMNNQESLEMAVDQIMKEGIAGYHPENYRETIQYDV